MNKLVVWLEGKKTYITALITFIVGGLTALGVEIPEGVWAMLGAVGLGSLRASKK